MSEPLSALGSASALPFQPDAERAPDRPGPAETASTAAAGFAAAFPQHVEGVAGVRRHLASLVPDGLRPYSLQRVVVRSGDQAPRPDRHPDNGGLHRTAGEAEPFPPGPSTGRASDLPPPTGGSPACGAHESGDDGQTIWTTLGTLDGRLIAPSYGLVSNNAGLHLATNDTADLLLFLDPRTRSRSTLEWRVISLDAALAPFLRALDNWSEPAANRARAAAAALEQEVAIARQRDGSSPRTLFWLFSGTGSQADPLRHTSHVTQLAAGGAVHSVLLAFAAHAARYEQTIAAQWNRTQFRFRPVPAGPAGSLPVQVEAGIRIRPIRSFSAIDADLQAGRDIPTIELLYHRECLAHPDAVPESLAWQQQRDTRLDAAQKWFRDAAEHQGAGHWPQ